MAQSHGKFLALAACLPLAIMVASGCGQSALPASQSALPAGQSAPPDAALGEFEQAKGIQPAVDTDGLKKSSLPRGPYKVVVDDVLEISMPLVLADAAGMDRDKAKPVPCRVGPDGAIVLPIAGRVAAAGKTLAQIEQEIIAVYYPRYVKREPSVMARVSEPHTEKVRVLGAVKEPGVYALRSDEMTLVSAILKAGGIPEGGAASIRIRAPRQEAKEALLPVRGLNVPFADVALAGGEEIEIARFCPVGLTVVGLVKKPGFFTTEPDGTFNLAQALAMAGGIDYQANPRYATVCRQAADGRLLSRPVRIDNENLSAAAAVALRPGDTVVVENSLESDVRIILLQALRMTVGAVYSIK